MIDWEAESRRVLDGRGWASEYIKAHIKSFFNEMIIPDYAAHEKELANWEYMLSSVWDGGFMVEYCDKQNIGHIEEINTFRPPSPILDWVPIGIAETHDLAIDMLEAYYLVLDDMEER